MIVGFNLPFDLSRLAIGVSPARGAFEGGFSFVLWDYFDAATGAYLGSFRVSDSTGSDDCDQTDGLDAYDGYLGDAFPNGLFVCQDGFNEAPGTSGTQNFKYAPLHLVDGVA